MLQEEESMNEHIKKPSATRTYVAVCNRINFDGHYFRKFILPTHGELVGWEEDGIYAEGSYTRIYPNTNANAAWYFLNELNSSACIDEVVSWEDYNDLKDQDDIIANRAQERIDFYPARFA